MSLTMFVCMSLIVLCLDVSSVTTFFYRMAQLLLEPGAVMTTYQISVGAVFRCFSVTPATLLFPGVAGTDIDAEHCRVECKGHQVVLHPLRGECFLNHALIREPVLLSQGENVQNVIVYIICTCHVTFWPCQVISCSWGNLLFSGSTTHTKLKS